MKNVKLNKKELWKNMFTEHWTNYSRTAIKRGIIQFSSNLTDTVNDFAVFREFTKAMIESTYTRANLKISAITWLHSIILAY